MVNPLFPRQGDLVFTFFSRSQLGNKTIYLWSKLSIPQKGISKGISSSFSLRKTKRVKQTRAS